MSTQQVLLAGDRPIRLEYLYSSSSLGSGSSKTVSSVPFGSESADRLIVVAVHWTLVGTATVSAINVDGISALNGSQTTGTNTGVGLWYFLVPANTSGTINITWTTGITQSYVGVWSIKEYQSSTRLDFANPAGGADTSRTASLDTALNGALIVACTVGGAPGSFTGADTDYSSTERMGGSLHPTAEQTNYNVSATCRCIVALSWR